MLVRPPMTDFKSWLCSFYMQPLHPSIRALVHCQWRESAFGLMSALPPSGQHLSIWNKANFPFHQPCLFHCFLSGEQPDPTSGYRTIASQVMTPSAMTLDINVLFKVCASSFLVPFLTLRGICLTSLPRPLGIESCLVVLSFCCLLFCWVLFHVYCPCKLLCLWIAHSDPLFIFLHHIFLVDVWLFMYFSCRALTDSHPANVTFQSVVCLCILAESFSYRTF